jgi:hypothetical protein
VSIVASAPTTRKTVLVLGRSASGLPAPASADIDGGIAVLAIGWPLTETQRSVLREAEDAARRARVLFDAHLLASADGVVALIGAHDRLMLDAGPREARQIRRALGAR